MSVGAELPNIGDTPSLGYGLLLPLLKLSAINDNDIKNKLMLDSYPLSIMHIWWHTFKYQLQFKPTNRNQNKRLYRLLFHAQFFCYEVLGSYLMADKVGVEPT